MSGKQRKHECLIEILFKETHTQIAQVFNWSNFQRQNTDWARNLFGNIFQQKATNFWLYAVINFWITHDLEMKTFLAQFIITYRNHSLRVFLIWLESNVDFYRNDLISILAWNEKWQCPLAVFRQENRFECSQIGCCLQKYRKRKRCSFARLQNFNTLKSLSNVIMPKRSGKVLAIRKANDR